MSLLPRAAFRASRVLRVTTTSTATPASAPQAQADAERASDASKAHQESTNELRKGAKRDPELYVLASVVTAALGFAGYYFGAKPTTASSEANVRAIVGSEPWNSGTTGKYQYHTKGVPKDAPSALHSVTIPDVTLPKYLHDQFNKYDKEEFDDY